MKHAGRTTPQTGSFVRGFGATPPWADYGQCYPVIGLTWIKKVNGRPASFAWSTGAWA
jgi:hypothetical protein